MTSALYRGRKMKMIFHFKSTFQFNLNLLPVQKHIGHSKLSLALVSVTMTTGICSEWTRRVGKQICSNVLEKYFLIDSIGEENSLSL